MHETYIFCTPTIKTVQYRKNSEMYRKIHVRARKKAVQSSHKRSENFPTKV